MFNSLLSESWSGVGKRGKCLVPDQPLMLTVFPGMWNRLYSEEFVK